MFKAGLDPAEIITSAIDSRDLAGSRDIAAVIDARIRERVDPLLPQPQGPWASRVPRRLGQYTAQTAPAWAVTALAAVPADPAARRDCHLRLHKPVVEFLFPCRPLRGPCRPGGGQQGRPWPVLTGPGHCEP